MEIVLFILGILAAIYIAYLASGQLRQEAKELKKLNLLMLRALENAGLAELNRNEKGEITGLIFDVKVSISDRDNVSIKPQIERDRKDTENE